MQGVPAFLQNLMGNGGDQQMQMITHPAANNQEGAPQVNFPVFVFVFVFVFGFVYL